MVYSISIFRRVICGLEPLRKTLPFLLLTDALAFSSHWGFRTSQQCQGIPRIAVVNFKALDFISLVWNLIWFQNSSKKVHRVLPTSENFTPDRGHHEACGLKVSEGAAKELLWHLGLVLASAPFQFAYFYHMACGISKCKIHATVLLQFYLLLTFFSPTKFLMECWQADFLLFQPFSKTILNISNCTS